MLQKNNTMKLNKLKLNKLKRDLKGLQSTVARELNLNRSTVSRALDGATGGDGIIEKCIEVRDRERKRISELENQI